MTSSDGVHDAPRAVTCRPVTVQIAPSILSADFANLEAEIARIPNADWIHVDVMDNHFVPNLTIGLPVVEALLGKTELPVDCHLMIDEPGFGGQSFLDVCLPKVRRARELVTKSGLDIWIQVDGGVSDETIERCADAGADVFVAGSAVYGAVDAVQAIDDLRRLAAE